MKPERWLACVLLLVGCAFTPSTDTLQTEHERLIATLAAPPRLVLDGTALELYAKTPGGTLLVVCPNAAEEDVLRDVQQRLHADQAVVFYGRRTTGQRWEHFLAGVDFVCEAVEITGTETGRPLVMDVAHGSRVGDALKGAAIGALTEGVPKAAKAAVGR